MAEKEKENTVVGGGDESNCKRVLHFVCHCVKWKLHGGDGENLEKWQTRRSVDNGKDDNKNGG